MPAEEAGIGDPPAGEPEPVTLRAVNEGEAPIFSWDGFPLINVTTKDGALLRTTSGCDLCTCAECAASGCAVCGQDLPFVAVLEPGESVDFEWHFSHWASADVPQCDTTCLRREGAPGDDFLVSIQYGRGFVTLFGVGVEPTHLATAETDFSREDRGQIVEVAVSEPAPTVGGVMMAATSQGEWSAAHVYAAPIDADETHSIVGVNSDGSWIGMLVPLELGPVAAEDLRAYVDHSSGWTGQVELLVIEDDRLEGTFDLSHDARDDTYTGSFVAPRRTMTE